MAKGGSGVRIADWLALFLDRRQHLSRKPRRIEDPGEAPAREAEPISLLGVDPG
jgi:hypothetical protein